MANKRLKKRACPCCSSSRISENKDFVSCNKCNWLHEKTEREKQNE